MSQTNRSLDDLSALARLHGVQTSYLDMAKRRRHVTAETLLAVLQTLGVPVGRMNDVPDVLRRTRDDRARCVLEPVHVVWRDERAAVALRLPNARTGGRLHGEWQLEDGKVLRADHRLERLGVGRVKRSDGLPLVSRLVPIPAGLPMGCHRVVLECAQGRFETQVLCAPKRCFQPRSRRRHWGVFAPLYALHSERSWGAGDFGDLASFATWVGEMGGQFVGTLPLLPAFLDRQCEPSPYSPVSRLFWNEFYLDLDWIPELATCPAAQRLLQSSTFQERLRKFRVASLVDYPAQMAAKRQVLEVLCRAFFASPSSRRREFDQFAVEHPHIADFARFRSVQEDRGGPWTRWPARLCGGDLNDGDCRPSLWQYHLYVQWLAHEQMSRLSGQARHRGVDLYLDMPLGVHRDGFDAWRFHDLFALDASGGAPPDPVFTQGQDWEFAPIHPQRSREQGHAYIRACLRHHLQHARMLRFDHVMGLHRLYWVPRGMPASGGAYVTYPAEEFYAMLSIESHRHRAVIVGENLGTVPPEVDRGLKRHGVAGMYVVQYAARARPRSALPPIPPNAVASFNTHDMPPFAGWWQGLDIDDRHALGLVKRGHLRREHRMRDRIRRAVMGLLVLKNRLNLGHTDAAAVARALTELLGASAARWVLMNLEDLWLETAPQNTPGTSTERINWRRKARFSLEALREQRGWLATLSALRRIRR